MHQRTRYGILGGTFDPPHIGHLIVAQEVYARLHLDRVWFIPTGTPPHKPGHDVSPAADRLAMVERAIDGDTRFAVSSIELKRPGPSYTVQTLRALRAQWGTGVSVYFMLGWDMLLYLPFWHDAPGVLAQLDGLVAVHRPGFEAGPRTMEELEAKVPGLGEKLMLTSIPQIEISSTEIRERVAHSLPIRYLVADTVREYIVEHRLYRPGAPGESAAAGPSPGDEEAQ